eukprot:4546612-Alexandrium_andersonii.AAC.1
MYGVPPTHPPPACRPPSARALQLPAYPIHIPPTDSPTSIHPPTASPAAFYQGAPMECRAVRG